MNIEKMINRRVSKGYSYEQSVELLQEVLKTVSPKNYGPALHYLGFITKGQAEKMQA